MLGLRYPDKIIVINMHTTIDYLGRNVYSYQNENKLTKILGCWRNKLPPAASTK
ncbi:hypothetical protein SAMN05444144_10510 [Flavobacterium akiainvivens]|nr:hypothetical protein SAMN05444144_10510 [Flavobacterium akiainvivens]